MADTHWRDHAACADPDVDAAWFHSGIGSSGPDPRALATCARCPVLEPCHGDAVAAGPDYRRSIVLAGVIYGHNGHATRAQPARCARAGCRTMVLASGTRRYCSDACMRAAEALRRLRRTAKAVGA